MKRYFRTIIVVLILGTLLMSCDKRQSKGDNGPIEVVATTGMVADLISTVGGDSVKVTALMGPGVDPHLYKATQGDLARLRKADVIFYNGLHLEGKMGEVFEKLSRIKPVFAIADGVEKSQLMADPSYPDAHDPHIWFDVSMWASTIPLVVDRLSSLDPDNRSYYEANGRDYQRRLTDLHQWVEDHLSQVPESKRILITAHDAFNYFGKAYNVEVRGLQGISTLSEFGLKDRVELVNFIVERDIAAVFVETSVSEKNINAIVEGCNKKGHKVHIGGNLFSDAMGASGSETGNYLGMVRHNVQTIVTGLKNETNIKLTEDEN